MPDDDILERIDVVLGHDETVIEDDWPVSPDAMRSRPPAVGELPSDHDQAAIRSVTVNFRIDVAAFMAAFARAAAAVSDFTLSAVSLQPKDDLIAIRLIAAGEREDALEWWNDHLDGVYADLGLERDPHIIRGEA